MSTTYRDLAESATDPAEDSLTPENFVPVRSLPDTGQEDQP